MPSFLTHALIGYLFFDYKGMIIALIPDFISYVYYFYKLSIPATENDQENIVDFNKNFFNKLSFSYFEFIKKNNVDDLIDPFIKFDRKYKNWSFINKSIILAIFSEIEISKKEKIKILINDYFNIAKSLITRKELGMINAITDKYINEKNII